MGIPLHDLALAGRQRLDDEIRVIETTGHKTAGIEHGLAAGQHLWPSLEAVSVVRERLWRASARGDPHQTHLTIIRRERDRAIVRPEAAGPPGLARRTA